MNEWTLSLRITFEFVRVFSSSYWYRIMCLFCCDAVRKNSSHTPGEVHYHWQLDCVTKNPKSRKRARRSYVDSKIEGFNGPERFQQTPTIPVSLNYWGSETKQFNLTFHRPSPIEMCRRRFACCSSKHFVQQPPTQCVGSRPCGCIYSNSSLSTPLHIPFLLTKPSSSVPLLTCTSIQIISSIFLPSFPSIHFCSGLLPPGIAFILPNPGIIQQAPWSWRLSVHVSHVTASLQYERGMFSFVAKNTISDWNVLSRRYVSIIDSDN